MQPVDDSGSTYPFETRRETGATATAETRRLHLIDNPLVALENNFLRLVPIAHLLCAREVGWVATVQILENTVLVLETAVGSLGSAILNGSQTPHGSP